MSAESRAGGPGPRSWARRAARGWPYRRRQQLRFHRPRGTLRARRGEVCSLLWVLSGRQGLVGDGTAASCRPLGWGAAAPHPHPPLSSRGGEALEGGRARKPWKAGCGAGHRCLGGGREEKGAPSRWLHPLWSSPLLVPFFQAQGTALQSLSPVPLGEVAVGPGLLRMAPHACWTWA